uniref:Uncharacterized protein n=1 Tax=Anguilla anguilla TaxID=7936 RepID=A0A0E9VE76_ANGAN
MTNDQSRISGVEMEEKNCQGKV